MRRFLLCSHVSLSMAVAYPGYALARDYFNPEFLETVDGQSRTVDLSAFESGAQASGNYRVDITLNGQLMETRDIAFTRRDDTLTACLSVALLKGFGIKTDAYPGLATAGECASIEAIPQARADFNFTTQTLALSIPQAALNATARGYVDPARWDDGISALLMNYSLSGARSASANDDSHYASLQPGINIGPWRLRNYSTWSRSSEGSQTWRSIYNYARRPVNSVQGQLTLGESNSSADIFDSVAYTGGELASDDDMLPDSHKGYAPVVRGVAHSSARVTIRQNGYVIYQNYVAPGAFEITDMYPTGGAGDLNVTVTESDGSERQFVVPYASLPLLQREGRLKYAVTAGQYRSPDPDVPNTPFAQLTAIYGLPWGLTVYGGVQQSENYSAQALGLGKNMGRLGALSADIIQAWSQPDGQGRQQGQSLRLRYSKNIAETGTHFALAGYRYSTAGYYSMQELLDDTRPVRFRNRAELTVSQNLGGAFGAISGSALRENYWDGGAAMTSFSVSYNNSWQGVSYSLTWSYNRNVSSSDRLSSDSDKQLALNISVPLAKFLPNSWANYGLNRSQQRGSAQTLGLSGVALSDNALTWSVQQTDEASSLNTTYRSQWSEMQLGYNRDSDNQTFNYALQGGVLAHADGITFSQALGETNVLVKAPGAKGVGIQNQSGARTDRRGYTVIGNLSPYRSNDVVLDTQSLAEDVDIELTSASVIPTRGAVVRAEYMTNIGLRVLMALHRQNGQPIPFGATVTLADTPQKMFIVGEEGEVYLTGLKNSGVLSVNWGNAEQRCQARYRIPEDQTAGVIITAAVCQ